MGELIFYSKIKSLQCFQCLAAVLSHVESLGNFKNKYKIKSSAKKKKKHEKETDRLDREKEEEEKKERETDRPIEKKKKKSLSKKKKKRGRRTDQQRIRRKKGKKKKKQLLHDATPASSSSSSFSPSLFSFLTNDVSARYPFTGRNSRISPVQPVRDQYGRYFFQYEIRVIYTGALIGTVYTGCTSQYGTELTSLALGDGPMS